MRGKTTIAASVEDVLRCTEDYETRKKWDELFNGGEILKSIDEHHQVITLKFKSPSMVVSNRDFVMARAVKREGNVILSNHVSVPYPDHGEQKGYVRGEIDVSGYVIEPLDDGKCTCTYVVQLDPKGVCNSVFFPIATILTSMHYSGFQLLLLILLLLNNLWYSLNSVIIYKNKCNKVSFDNVNFFKLNLGTTWIHAVLPQSSVLLVFWQYL